MTWGQLFNSTALEQAAENVTTELSKQWAENPENIMVAGAALTATTGIFLFGAYRSCCAKKATNNTSRTSNGNEVEIELGTIKDKNENKKKM